MSEFKISCPHCNQHMMVDDAWAGQTINCPSCQQAFAVPGPPPAAQYVPPPPASGLRISASAPPSPAPPGSAPSRVQATASAPKTSGLAITSLVLSVLGCFGLFAIAGVICGHIARGQIRRNPALGGQGFATVALVIGYLFIALNVVFGVKFILDVRQRVHEVRAQRSGQYPAVPGASSPRSGGLINVQPQSSVPAPAGAVNGTVKGEPFSYTRSTLALTVGSLEIDGRQAMTEGSLVTIFLRVKPGESFANRTWHITPTMAPGVAPTVFVLKLHAGSSTKDRIASGYEMELTTGDITGGARTATPYVPAGAGGSISGTITLKIAGTVPVDIKGNFTAMVN